MCGNRDGGPDTVTAPDDALSVRDYLDLMLAGNFPEPSLRIPAAARRRWFAGYVEQMLIGIEVKAAATVTASDARHLAYR